MQKYFLNKLYAAGVQKGGWFKKWRNRPIRQSNNPTNFPSFPCFPWTKNGLWAPAHAKLFRVVRG
jgi:hypothetical protein